MSTPRLTGACALCGVVGPLCRSHIVPNFVTKFLIATSPRGSLRGGDSPNVPLQSGQRADLLCDPCEGLFARWECLFAEQVFLPHHRDGVPSHEYGDWLLRFALSLSWRVATTEIDSHGQGATVDRLRGRLAEWRDSILGRRPLPFGDSHHVLLAPTLARLFVALGLREALISFPWRCVDGAIVRLGRGSVDTAVVVTTIPGFSFLSFLDPPGPGLTATEIQPRARLGGRQGFSDAFAARVVARIYSSRVAAHRAMSSRASRRQVEKVTASLYADLGSGTPSLATQAWATEGRLRKMLAKLLDDEGAT